MNVRRLAVLSLLLAIATLGDARAQSDYPNKPVRIILDSAAGSANDATSRILADKLGKIWNQQVLTVNQPGAGGAISARVAAGSPADGYTLYLPATSPFLALPGVSGVAPNLPIELPRDFMSISFVLQQPLFIGVSHSSGITSIAQVIELAKQKPGEIAYAATGRGRLTHLTMELLQARAGVKLQLVPYAGGTAQALNDVISGRIPLVLDAYAGLAAAIRGDLIKGLANTSLERLPGFENMPTVAETLPGFFVGAWNVMLAPNRHAGGDRAQGQRRPAHGARRSGGAEQVSGKRRVREIHDAGGGHRLRAVGTEDVAADPRPGRARDGEVMPRSLNAHADL